MRTRRVRYGKHACRRCGVTVTNNAMGRAQHERSEACEKGRVIRRLKMGLDPYPLNRKEVSS